MEKFENVRKYSKNDVKRLKIFENLQKSERFCVKFGKNLPRRHEEKLATNLHESTRIKKELATKKHKRHKNFMTGL